MFSMQLLVCSSVKRLTVVSFCSPCSADARMLLLYDNCLVAENSSEAICTV